LADNGTLFLDEIGEMDFSLQAKLLRFLQERTIQRVGSSRTINVDVRVLSATNRDPLTLVREGRLREDLYYRLNVLPIEVPPLRDRREDIPLLAKYFMHRLSEANGKRVSSIGGEVLDALERYDWPGNVRQLENITQRMVILSPNGHIVRELLPPELLAQLPPNGVNGQSQIVENDNLRPIERLERQAIIDALENCQFNVVRAAELLGMAQATIYRKIKRYGIELKRWRRGTPA
jgi:DNA-binding NtrC family response regulator